MNVVFGFRRVVGMIVDVKNGEIGDDFWCFWRTKNTTRAPQSPKKRSRLIKCIIGATRESR